jgi:preprotein translocase subunit SecG
MRFAHDPRAKLVPVPSTGRYQKGEAPRRPWFSAMTWVITLVTFVHVIVCLFIIVVVLLQSGKAGDIAAAFGGMGSQTAFGPRGAANLLEKATTWSAIIFMVTSITLTIWASRRSSAGSSVFGNSNSVPTQKAPAR